MDDQNQSPPPNSAPAETPLAPEVAKQQIESLMQDRDFGARFTAGDKAAAEQLDRLQRAAIGAAPPEPPKPDPRANEPRRPPEPSAQELDTRTAQERAAAVPDDPDGYHALPYGAPINTEAAIQIDSNVRTWLHAIETPQGEAESLVEMGVRDQHKFETMAPDAMERHAADTQQRFNKMFGEEAPAALDGARRLIRDLDRQHPGLVDFLEQSQLGNSLSVLVAAANAAKKRYK